MYSHEANFSFEFVESLRALSKYAMAFTIINCSVSLCVRPFSGQLFFHDCLNKIVSISFQPVDLFSVSPQIHPIVFEFSVICSSLLHDAKTKATQQSYVGLFFPSRRQMSM